MNQAAKIAAPAHSPDQKRYFCFFLLVLWLAGDINVKHPATIVKWQEHKINQHSGKDVSCSFINKYWIKRHWKKLHFCSFLPPINGLNCKNDI